MNKEISARIPWIDNLKFFCLFLVVYGHIGTSSVHTLIYGFHMPMFFFLSGMLHKDKSICNACQRLLVPYILFNFLYLLVESPWLYRMNGNTEFLLAEIEGIIYPRTNPIDFPTWFLLSLFEIKVILRLLHNNVKLTGLLSCVTFMLFILSHRKLVAPLFLQNTIIGMVFYCIGATANMSIKKTLDRVGWKLAAISGGDYYSLCYTDAHTRRLQLAK